MAGNTTIEIETEAFKEMLERYVKVNKRTAGEIVNRKAYNVAKNAVRLTRKANNEEIKTFFKAPNGPTGHYILEDGTKVSRKRQHRWDRVRPVLHKAFKLKGKPKEHSNENMAKWAKILRSMRLKSIGYLRSGWIPAIEDFGETLRARKTIKGVKQHGRRKGIAVVAKKKADKALAIIGNSTGRKTDQAKAAQKFGKPALARAIRAERRSSEKYIERKYKEAFIKEFKEALSS